MAINVCLKSVAKSLSTSFEGNAKWLYSCNWKTLSQDNFKVTFHIIVRKQLKLRFQILKLHLNSRLLCRICKWQICRRFWLTGFFFKIQQHTTLLPLISSVSQSVTYRYSKVYLMMMVSTIQSYALTHILTMGNQPLFCHYIDLWNDRS